MLQQHKDEGSLTGIPRAVDDEIGHLEENIRKFRAGELGEVKMQKLRLHFGTYAQRQEGVQMQRIKIPGGILNSDQLSRLADAADFYGSGFIHFTTREDAQIYYVRLEQVPELLRSLAQTGITTREACGNTVRNITACYRAGTSPTEAFDVTPYTQALFHYLVRNTYDQNLGRKFKITFEGCTEDHSGVRVHDIGFIAVTRGANGNTTRGFKVYLGGGLGGAPQLARLYTDFLPHLEIFNLAAAILRLFDRFGERKSRMKARMKFLIQTLGWTEFVRELDLERARVGRLPQPEYFLEETLLSPASTPFNGNDLRVIDPRTDSPAFQTWLRDNVVPHKTPGLRGVHVRLKLGDLIADHARRLAEVARQFAEGEIRISIAQNLFLPAVEEHRLPDLFDALTEIGLHDAGAETVADVTTCPGADTCRLGIASAKGLGSEISEAFDRELASHRELARSLKIKISGCPNGCAQHSIADIGFHAASLTAGERTVPAYLLFIGGRTRLDDAAIGRVHGRFPARNGVRVLQTLLDIYQQHKLEGEEFGACLDRLGDAYLSQQLEALKRVPAFEEDPSFYQDFGHENERFAVRQGIKGECAGSTIAEIVPSIEHASEWLAQSEAYFYHHEFQAAALAAYEAAASAARVPLYQRLVDPFTSGQALWEFENIFVLSGETSGAWPELSRRFEQFKKQSPSESAAREILDEARSFLGYCVALVEGGQRRYANAAGAR